MNTVYKYCRHHGIAILEDLELKVTPPNQFNDPFEFSPRIAFSDPAAYAEMHGTNILKLAYATECRAGTFAGTVEEFLELHSLALADTKQEFIRLLPLGAAGVEVELLDAVSQRLAILCLSGHRNSILMWGHYCDKPLGLAIGFDKSCPIFQIEKGLRPVRYVKERVLFDPCWHNASAEMVNYDTQIVLSKSDAWAYENEFRQVFNLTTSSLVKKPLKDKNHTPGYFLPFPPEAIVSVTLGPRCTPELELAVRRTLQKPCFAKVIFDRAKLHDKEFGLSFEPCDK